MDENKSTISQGQSYQEIGEFWDDHDLGEFWEATQSADFVVSGRGSTVYYQVENALSQKIHSLAQERGVSAQTLVNRWLQEKLEEAV